MTTDQLLHLALNSAADATDQLVPGSGRHYRNFADEMYATLWRIKECIECGKSSSGTVGQPEWFNEDSGMARCVYCGQMNPVETMKVSGS